MCSNYLYLSWFHGGWHKGFSLFLSYLLSPLTILFFETLELKSWSCFSDQFEYSKLFPLSLLFLSVCTHIVGWHSAAMILSGTFMLFRSVPRDWDFCSPIYRTEALEPLSGVRFTHWRLEYFFIFSFWLFQFNRVALDLSLVSHELLLLLPEDLQKELLAFFYSLFISCCNFLIQSSHSQCENTDHSVTI